MIIKKRGALGWSLVGLLIWSLFLAGCSTIEKRSRASGYSAELQAVLSGQAILGRELSLDELPSLDLFSITAEMEVFAEQAVRRSGSTFERVKALHYALLLPEEEGGRGMVYNAFSTQVPIAAFQERRVNCLSFSLLYVALAQHLKLNAHINEVQTPPVWNLRDNDALFLMRHVNVKVPLHDENFFSANSDDVVVDLEMGRYKSTYSQRYISNALVAAQFYSNRGMEIAAEGNREQAFLYLRKALQEDNQQSYIWNNFASLYTQRNLLREAEVIYLHGLEVNPDDLSIMANLAGLYHRMGDSDKAAAYSKLAQRYRQRNPYYQYALALSAVDNQDYNNALHFVRRAIELGREEPRFYQLAASIYTQLGDLDAAQLMQKKYSKAQMHR